MRQRRWWLALLAAVLVLGAACGGDSDDSEDSDAASNAGSETESSQPSEEPTEGSGGGGLTIEAVDFAFKTPATAPAGETEITFENNGKEMHQLIMARLKEGAPDLSKLIELPQNEVDKYIDEEIEDAAKPIKPGDSTTFTTDLQPGLYAMVCFVEKDGKPHAFLGMVNQLTVE